MPQGTAKPTEPERHDLATLEGGYVTLRKLTYGEILKRRDLGGVLTPGEGRNDDPTIAIDQTAVTMYEFAHAVVDHNITDDKDRVLNFRNRADVDALDPVIASEIEDLIREMNPQDSSKSDRAKSVGS